MQATGQIIRGRTPRAIATTSATMPSGQESNRSAADITGSAISADRKGVLTVTTTSPNSGGPTPVDLQILLTLARGDLHRYAITLVIAERTGGRMSLGPGTLWWRTSSGNMPREGNIASGRNGVRPRISANAPVPGLATAEGGRMNASGALRRTTPTGAHE